MTNYNLALLSEPNKYDTFWDTAFRKSMYSNLRSYYFFKFANVTFSSYSFSYIFEPILNVLYLLPPICGKFHQNDYYLHLLELHRKSKKKPPLLKSHYNELVHFDGFYLCLPHKICSSHIYTWLIKWPKLSKLLIGSLYRSPAPSLQS